MKEESETGRVAHRKAPDGTPDRTAAIEATRLLGKWTRASGQHLSFGARCACGMTAGAGKVQLQDFETQILDFLFRKHGGLAADPVLAVLRTRAGYRPGEAGSITEFLRAIATEAPGPGAELQIALLRDLERSIDSFDELHRG